MSCDPNALLSASACWTCLPMGQLQIIRVQLLADILKAVKPVAAVDFQSLLSQAACFTCLSPGQLQIIEVQLLCEILQAGGASGTNACLIAQRGPPVGTCGFPFGIWYDPDPNSPTAGNFWFWSALASPPQWVNFLI